jgi:hypothetical protein
MFWLKSAEVWESSPDYREVVEEWHSDPDPVIWGTRGVS